MMKLILILSFSIIAECQKCRLMTEDDCFQCLKASQSKQCNFCDPREDGLQNRCTGHPLTKSGIHAPRCPKGTYNVRSTGMDCLIAGYAIPVPEDSLMFPDVSFEYSRMPGAHPNGNGLAIYTRDGGNPTTISQYEKDMAREGTVHLISTDSHLTVLEGQDKPFLDRIDEWLHHNFKKDATILKIKEYFTRTVLQGYSLLDAIGDSMIYPTINDFRVLVRPISVVAYGDVHNPVKADMIPSILSSLVRPNELRKLSGDSFKVTATQIYALCTCETDIEDETGGERKFAHVQTSFNSDTSKTEYRVKIIKLDCTTFGECDQIFCGGACTETVSYEVVNDDGGGGGGGGGGILSTDDGSSGFYDLSSDDGSMNRFLSSSSSDNTGDYHESLRTRREHKNSDE